MYLWKCWHDSRYRFLALLAASVGTACIAVGPRVHRSAHGLAHITDPAAQAALWNDLMIVADIASLLMYLGAMVLGAGLLADESASTMQFLFTRPRRRRYFVWTAWSTALLETIAAGASAILVAMGVAIYCTRYVDFRPLVLVLLMLPELAVICGMSYLLSLLLKSGRRGLSAAFLAMFAYVAVLTFLRFRWQVRTPWWWFTNLTDLLPEGGSSLPHNPAFAVLGWIGVALLFPLASQALMERREI